MCCYEKDASLYLPVSTRAQRCGKPAILATVVAGTDGKSNRASTHSDKKFRHMECKDCSNKVDVVWDVCQRLRFRLTILVTVVVSSFHSRCLPILESFVIVRMQ